MALSFSVLGIRDFRVTLITRFCVMMAWVSQDVIIGWQVYHLTGDYLMLGLVGLTEAVPALICALFAGHIVDISRPYKVFLTCVGIMSINSFWLMMIGGEHIDAPGGSIVTWLFIGIFISGVTRAFIMPASFALLPQIVPRKQMAAASAWLTSNFQMAMVLAPAVAGLVYGVYQAYGAWFIPVTFIVLAFTVYLVGLSASPRQWRSIEKREPAAQSIKAGWKYIFTNRILLAVMALDMFAVLFGGAVAMLPAYANEILHVGTEGLGALRAAPAVGAIFTALILAVRPFKKIKATTMLCVVAGFGFCIIGFGLSQVFWVSMLCLFMSGVFDSVSMVIRSTLMQILTPDSMRGRVSAVNSMFIISSNEIGSFESGVAAKLLGLVPSVVFGGLMTLGVVVTTALVSPKLRKTVVDTSSKE